MGRGGCARALAATVLLALLPHSLAGSALLLGYRLTTEPPPSSAYGTVLVVSDGNGVRLAAWGSGLVVSRSDGFWSVDVARMTSGLSRREFAVARPARAPSRSASQVPGFREGCRETTELSFLFVGPTHASLEALENLECPAREYRYRDRLLGVVSFGTLAGATASTLKRVTISSVVGPAATSALVEAARRAGVRPTPKDASSLDTFNWALVRRQGRWIVRARHRQDGGPAAPTLDFTVPTGAPRSMVGHDQLVPSWQAVTRAAPNVLDAFSSPAGDLTVVLTRGELLVYRVRRDALDPRPAARFPLPGPAAAVVVQWTVDVEGWTRAVRGALGQ